MKVGDNNKEKRKGNSEVEVGLEKEMEGIGKK